MINSLVVIWDFDPVMFTLGSLEIRYYGLMWALALLLGGWFFGNFCKREHLNPELADSIFVYGALATVIGARLGHCLFYEPLAALDHHNRDTQWRHGKPRSCYRSADRIMALLTQKQDALHLVA